MSAWQARVLTIFPDAFPGPLGISLAGKALERGLWSLEVVNLRDFAKDKHRSVDDTPFGGGAGMVLRPDVVDEALSSLTEASSLAGLEAPAGPLVYLSPRGRLLDQRLVRDFAAAPGMTLLCGRYEGVDQRVLDHHGALELSVGDYVLAGGEVAAMTVIEAVLRLLPGVMGNTESGWEETFEEGLLEYPHYTRPAEWRGQGVPEVLLSGHHADIRRWRLQQAEELTRRRRPDLWECYRMRRTNESDKQE